MFSPRTPSRSGKKRRRGPIIGHGNYYGPGNSLPNGRPVDGIDRDARRHDYAYQNYIDRGEHPYTHYNRADDQLMSSLKKRKVHSLSEQGWRAVGIAAFGVKRVLFPRMNESNNLIKEMNSSSSIRRMGTPRNSRDVLSRGKYALYGSYGQDEMSGRNQSTEIQYAGFTSFKMPSALAANKPTYQLGNATYPEQEALYSTHSIGGDIFYHISAALLRTILREELRYEHTNADMPLQCYLNNHGTSAIQGNNPGFRLDFISRDEHNTTYQEKGPAAYKIAGTIYSNRLQTTPPEEAVTTGPQKTFRAVAREIAYVLGNFIRRTQAEVPAVSIPAASAAFNPTNRPGLKIVGYTFTIPDSVSISAAASDAVGYVVGMRNLEDRYFKAYSRVQVSMQNVTAGSLSSAGEIYDKHRLDATSLTGRMYKFHNSMPKVNTDQAIITPGVNAGYTVTDQLKVAGAGAYASYTNDWSSKLQFDVGSDTMINPNRQPKHQWSQFPSRSMFKNCSGMSSFNMLPGAARVFDLNFSFDGTLNNFLNKLLISNYAVGNDKIGDFRTLDMNNDIGTSVLVVTEKAMSFGSDVKVTLNYEVKVHAGAYFKRAKRQPMMGMKLDLYSAKVANYDSTSDGNVVGLTGLNQIGVTLNVGDMSNDTI